MPLSENLNDLIIELQRPKLREWRDDPFSDLTEPCEQDDVETFLQNLRNRVAILKKRGSVSQKLSILLSIYKKMDKNPVQKSQSKIPQPSDKATGGPEKGKKGPFRGLKQGQGDGKPPKSSEENASEQPKNDHEKIEAQKGTQLLKIKKETLSECQKVIDEWLDHIERLLTSPELTEFHVNQVVIQSAVKMESVANKIKRIVSENKKFESKQKEMKDELDRCCRKMGSVTESHTAVTKKLKSKTDEKSTLTYLTEMTESLINRYNSFETEQKEVKEELDRCCEKLGSATETKAATIKLLKSKTDVTSRLTFLAEKTESLIKRYDSFVTKQKEVKEELDRCCEKLGSATETKAETIKTLKSQTDVTSRLTFVAEKTESLIKRCNNFETMQKELKEELDRCCEKIGAITETQAAKTNTLKSKSDVTSTLTFLTENTEIIINRLKDTEIEMETVKDKIKKLEAENETLSNSKAKDESQHKLLEFEKQLERYKDAFSRLEDLCKVEGMKNSQSVEEKMSHAKNEQNGQLAMNEMVEMVRTKISEIRHEESYQRQQNLNSFEAFKTIHDACLPILEQNETMPGNVNENSGRQQGNAARKLEKMDDRAVEMVLLLTDRYNKSVGITKNYKSEKMELMKEKQEAEETISELRHRLSRYMGADLMTDNPNIADLSDSNRPTKLAESFSELYDNDWTNALDELQKKTKMTDTDVVKSLLEILKFAFEYCHETADRQLNVLLGYVCTPAVLQIESSKKEISPKDIDTVSKQALNDLRKKTFAVASRNLIKYSSEVMKRENISDEDYKSKSCQKYIMSCIDICWLMSIQSPPVYLDFEIDTKGKFDDKKYKAYLKAGKKIDYMVWPPIYISKGGNLLAKGVVQGK